jgi:hypothetical protein
MNVDTTKHVFDLMFFFFGATLQIIPMPSKKAISSCKFTFCKLYDYRWIIM